MKAIYTQQVEGYNPEGQTWVFQGNAVHRKKTDWELEMMEARALERQEEGYDDVKRGKKRASTGFTSRSAKTLSILLATLDYSKAMFLTLTHSSSNHRTPQEAKLALMYVFFKRLVRRYPTASGVWRLEKQANGEPHFHIVLFGVDNTLNFLIFAAEAWKDAMQLDHTPRIELTHIRKGTGAYIYLAGHSSKRSQTWAGQEVGRYWGKFAGARLPFLPASELYITSEIDALLKRMWDNKERRRVKWMKARYGFVVEPRLWELANVKLFYRPPYAILLRYARRYGILLT